MNTAKLAYYYANRERLLATQRAYAQVHLPERRARQKERYKENPEKAKQYAREYRARHPEEVATAKRQYHQANFEADMWRRARRRAQKKGWAFDIEPADIVVPEVCPLLGIVLDRGARNHNKSYAPSLDRKDPRLGYVKGNIWVVSLKANTMKNDATLEELELLTTNLRKALKKS